MVEQITRGIKISVKTNFEGTFYKNYKMHFAFGYIVTIENHSSESIQLTSRHWEIHDSLNETEVIEGEGVVGKKPILKPGEKYSYGSGCLLASTYGSMKGYYNMISFNSSKNFKVTIPKFKLSAPFALN